MRGIRESDDESVSPSVEGRDRGSPGDEDEDSKFARADTAGGRPDDRFGEEGDNDEVQPIMTAFKDIIINRSNADWKNRKDAAVQTDTEMFFKYIFDFLGELERRINSGELSIEDILAMGRQAQQEQMEEEGRQWVQGSPEKNQMYFTVQELKECLLRLKSLGAHGGDIFF